ARGGATFRRREDGWWLAGGERPERDEYRFTAELEPALATSLRALRVEALADPSLPHGGPGRADNGNFGLTELVAKFSPRGAARDAAAPLAFARAASTFDQAGLPAAAAIDGNDAQDAPGRAPAASFALAQPVDLAGGGTLVVTLRFKTNVFHSIGRLRVSIGAEAAAAPDAPARSAAVVAALATYDAAVAGGAPDVERALA